MTREEYCPCVKFVATVLVTVLIVLPALARGSPVCPCCFGFWNRGALEDVVFLLPSALFFLDPGRGPAIQASGTLSAVFTDPTGAVAQCAHEPGTPRGPPAAY